MTILYRWTTIPSVSKTSTCSAITYQLRLFKYFCLSLSSLTVKTPVTKEWNLLLKPAFDWGFYIKKKEKVKYMNILTFSFMNLCIVCFLLLFYNPVIYLHDCVSMWHHRQVSSSSRLAQTDSKLLLAATGVTALFTRNWRIRDTGNSSQISIKSSKTKQQQKNI